jgi:hypothetical protein
VFIGTGERSFVKPNEAVLKQHFFIRTSNNPSAKAAFGFPSHFADLPIEPNKTLEILTVRTPNILNPNDAVELCANSHETPCGRIFLHSPDGGVHLPGLVFWPRVHAGETGDVVFSLVAHNEAQPLETSLIFVDTVAANASSTMAALVGYCEARQR